MLVVTFISQCYTMMGKTQQLELCYNNLLTFQTMKIRWVLHFEYHLKQIEIVIGYMIVICCRIKSKDIPYRTLAKFLC